MNKIQVAVILLTILAHLHIRYKIKVSVKLRDDGSEHIDVDVRPTVKNLPDYTPAPCPCAFCSKSDEATPVADSSEACRRHSWKGGDKCLKCGVKR